MTLEVVVFIFGALLLLTGILGGGFELKELKIPQVGRWPRIASLLAGIVLVMTGIGLVATPEDEDGQNPAATRGPTRDSEAQPATAVEKPVTFSVVDQLGEGQVSEQVTLLINGRSVGQLTVNEDYPESQLSVTVPRAGDYSYTIEARAVFRDSQGDTVEYSGVGQGSVGVDQGKIYSVVGSFSGNTWLVSLKEEG